MSQFELMRVAEEDAVEADKTVRPEKSPTALKTIGEVADELDLPQHVLRFWESKFEQIKPLKRRGGRRFYRPEDVAVIRRIKELLYAQGYTIRGAEKAIAHGDSREHITGASNDDSRYGTNGKSGELQKLLVELKSLKELLAPIE